MFRPGHAFLADFQDQLSTVIGELEDLLTFAIDDPDVPLLVVGIDNDTVGQRDQVIPLAPVLHHFAVGVQHQNQMQVRLFRLGLLRLFGIRPQIEGHALGIENQRPGTGYMLIPARDNDPVGRVDSDGSDGLIPALDARLEPVFDHLIRAGFVHSAPLRCFLRECGLDGHCTRRNGRPYNQSG